MSEELEGFICPICMANLGDQIQLTVHFEEKHSKEDPEILKNLKDIFAKAKNSIVKKDPSTSELNQSAADISINQPPEFTKDLYGYEPSAYNPVSGIHYDRLKESDNTIEVTALFNEFRQERSKRVDIRAMDINKLILRLERLMTQLPSDPMKRRIHEQSVVPWINEKDVSLCPNCAKSFGMTRRKHHCRLCGAVMCAECSDLVSFELAQRLINPATISKFHQDDQEQVSPSKSSSRVSYDRIMSNLVDLAGFAEAQRNFRSCQHCKEVLDQRDQRLSLATAPDPQLVMYYEKLQSWFQTFLRKSEAYRQMAQSLHDGESTYQIKETNERYVILQDNAVKIKALGELIASVDEEDPTYNLRKRIDVATKNFVRDNFLGLPKPPTESEFEQIKIQKAEEAMKRVEAEKQAAEEARRKSKTMKSSTNMTISNSSTGLSTFSDSVQSKITNAVNEAKPRFSKLGGAKRNEVKMGKGFVASVSGQAQESSDDDPFGQQIYVVKQMIQQAKSAGQFDNVRILEANLHELQEEYRKRKTEEQHELERNYEDFKDLFSKPTDSIPEDFDESNPFFEDTNNGDE